jgi:drug/metabolite transporter (DMT)-like permease
MRVESSLTAPRSEWFKLHVSVFMLSCTSLFARAMELDALTLTGGRTVVASIALALYLAATGQLRPTWVGTKLHVGAVTISGVLMAAHWVTYFSAVKWGGIALGMASFFTYPIHAAWIEPLIERRKVSWRDAGPPALACIGIALVVHGGGSGSEPTMGVVAGVISGLCFSLRNLLARHRLRELSGPPLMFLQVVITALLLVSFSASIPGRASPRELGLLVILGVFFTGFAHALFLRAHRTFSVQTTGLISSLQPIYGTTMGAFLLAEVPPLLTALGGALVVSAAGWETWLSSRSQLATGKSS